MAGRLTLALYNSYDPRRFREAHRRALARAAPLAWGFDANLATLGFPTDELGGDVESASTASKHAQRDGAPVLDTARDLARFVADTTTIGDGGTYLRELADAGRFHTHPRPSPGFPPQLGSIVLTTRDPDPRKSTTPRAVAESLRYGESTTLVFGLGPHGVPSDVHDVTRKHLDVTGRGVSLETATALGAVVGAVAAWREALPGD